MNIIIKRFVLLSVFAVIALLLNTNDGFGALGMEDVDVNFTGHIQSTYVLRDNQGIQYDFLRNTEGVQWRQELKFDVSIAPKYDAPPPLRVSKIFFSYRGAYDAIYDLRNKYNAIPDSRRDGGSRYDTGLDDLRIENDLREVFFDVTANAGQQGTLNSRLGRQIIQWGEADGFNLVNIVNPQDNRSLMFFSNPDDLANPIWMGRFDYSSGNVGPFSNFSAQFLVIPDNRPSVYAATDQSMVAPYAYVFQSLRGFDMRQNDNPSTFNDMPYGFRLGFQKGPVTAYLYHFNGFQAAPALNFSDLPVGKIMMDHPRLKMYGASFNYAWDAVAGVLRGEASYTDSLTYLDLRNSYLDPSGNFSNLAGYTSNKTYQALLGFDKALHPKFIGTDSALTTTYQVYWRGIDGWNFADFASTPYKQNTYRVSVSASTDYFHGTISPSVFLMYDLSGVLMTMPTIEYTPDGKWYFDVSAMMAFGDKHAVCDYNNALLTEISEFSFRMGYRW